jgi:hypothetical protein
MGDLETTVVQVVQITQLIEPAVVVVVPVALEAMLVLVMQQEELVKDHI